METAEMEAHDQTLLASTCPCKKESLIVALMEVVGDRIDSKWRKGNKKRGN
jgi:hypothetical protein